MILLCSDMAKELKQRIFDTVHSGLNSTVQSLQAAVQAQPYGSAFYPTTLNQLASRLFFSCLLLCCQLVILYFVLKMWKAVVDLVKCRGL